MSKTTLLCVGDCGSALVYEAGTLPPSLTDWICGSCKHPLAASIEERRKANRTAWKEGRTRA